MELGERIAAAREHARLTQDVLAKRIGMAQQSLQAVESGKSKGTTKLAEICLETGVSLRWLARNEGSMLESQSARPDRETLASAMKVLEYLAQMQTGAAKFLTDADAILAAYDYLSSRDSSQEIDLSGASRRMAAWLRGRDNEQEMERG